MTDKTHSNTKGPRVPLFTEDEQPKLKKDGTPKKSGGARPNTGGVRPGAGRKPRTAEQVEEQANLVTRELIFPALCQAFNADPGRYRNRYLSVELSKTDIRRAYGTDGLKVWCRFFRQEKIGGRDRNGNGYKTRWGLHLGIYSIANLLVKSLGHELKELPNQPFTGLALRLMEMEAKRIRRQFEAELENTKSRPAMYDGTISFDDYVKS